MKNFTNGRIRAMNGNKQAGPCLGARACSKYIQAWERLRSAYFPLSKTILTSYTVGGYGGMLDGGMISHVPWAPESG